MILSKKSMFPILLICLGISLSIIARFLNDLFVFPLVKTLYVSILLFSLLLGSLGFFKRINESKSFIIEFFSYLGLNVVYYYVLHNYLTVAFRFVYTHMGISVPDAIYVSMNLFFTIIVCSAVAQVCKKYHIFNIVFIPIKEIKRIRQRTKNPVA